MPAGDAARAAVAAVAFLTRVPVTRNVALADHGPVVTVAVAAGALSRAGSVGLGRALPNLRTDGAAAAIRVSAAGAAGACVLAAGIAVAARGGDGLVLVAVAAGLCVAL